MSAVPPAASRPVPLSNATLGDLPEHVEGPQYDRSTLTPGIVHIGVGAFHRARQGVYLDRLAKAGHTNWGWIGVGLRRPEIGEVMQGQDRLYLVVERGPEADSARVVGAMTQFLFGPDQSDAVLDALVDERSRLVTMTITGSSYFIDSHTGDFEPGDDEGGGG